MGCTLLVPPGRWWKLLAHSRRRQAMTRAVRLERCPFGHFGLLQRPAARNIFHVPWSGSCFSPSETYPTNDLETKSTMSGSPPPEERDAAEAERKAKEDAEQAALPYKWTQTIKDVDVTISIDGKYKGRDLDVKISKKALRVAIKGQDPIIDVSVVEMPSRFCTRQRQF